jgi:phosphate transport system permease protein
LWLSLIMMLFAVPVGTAAALYLEEYKTSGRLARIIQTNINNLAGVPSVVYGIMGAFVFVELIFKPLHLWNEGISVRNVIGGGMTLGLLTLPVVIVSAQEAIRAVPNSIRQGAYALGATHWQCIWTQVLPLARPGIMTGTILAVSRAIGEAAPLILFGATTFIAYTPNPFSEFTVLPIQIYNWAERPTNPVIDGHVVRQWNFNMALASMVLLVMLLCLNGMAIYVRNRAQKAMRY